jgi:hypothetical protein
MWLIRLTTVFQPTGVKAVNHVQHQRTLVPCHCWVSARRWASKPPDPEAGVLKCLRVKGRLHIHKGRHP